MQQVDIKEALLQVGKPIFISTKSVKRPDFPAVGHITNIGQLGNICDFLMKRETGVMRLSTRWENLCWREVQLEMASGSTPASTSSSSSSSYSSFFTPPPALRRDENSSSALSSTSSSSSSSSSQSNYSA